MYLVSKICELGLKIKPDHQNDKNESNYYKSFSVVPKYYNTYRNNNLVIYLLRADHDKRSVEFNFSCTVVKYMILL